MYNTIWYAFNAYICQIQPFKTRASLVSWAGQFESRVRIPPPPPPPPPLPKDRCFLMTWLIPTRFRISWRYDMLTFQNIENSYCLIYIQKQYIDRVKRICVFEHSVMTDFNCPCPAIQRGQGSFCLKVPLDSLLLWASSGGSGKTARMRRLVWTFAARKGDNYQIRLTRPIW